MQAPETSGCNQANYRCVPVTSSALSENIIIEKIIKGGLGMGRRADGMVVMIPDVLPGEEVRAGITRKRKNFLEANLLEVLTPSGHRCVPPCPYDRECGGCGLAHGDYESQLAIKDDILRELLLRERVLSREKLSAVVGPPLRSARTLHYRQRIRLQVENGRAGFYGARSHDLIPIKACLLAREEINAALAQLAREDDFHLLLEQCNAIELLASELSGRVTLLLHFSRKVRPTDRKQARTLCKSCEKIEAVLFLASDQAAGPLVTQDGEEQGTGGHRIGILIKEDGPSAIRLTFEPGGFCQVNLEQNRNCIMQMLAWAEAAGVKSTLDLFCGMGNFSIPLAGRGNTVVGMDLQRSAIRSARRNGEEAGLANCSFSQESAGDAARRLVAEKARFDLILLDPPRAGCAEVIGLLPQLAAKNIIYISCDPATLVRDLAGLGAAGYAVREVRMVDMFPQTPHLESMVLLEKSD